ncbi:MAG: amino acid ABC transporter permease [Anaerolineales bacterium]
MSLDPVARTTERGAMSLEQKKDPLTGRLYAVPWWLLAVLGVLVWAWYFVFSEITYKDAFDFIYDGIGLTISTTLSAYAISLVIGLVMGLGRVSRNVVFRNLARFYVEVVRGIPMLVLIFYVAFVATVDFASLFGLAGRDIPMNVRAIIALAITYGAFSAEIFRAGIQSIGHGQMEAARSLGMSYAQAMRYVILPQAIRNVLPALANDFVAMLKDSSLVSVLAVRDITQMARLRAGSTFRFRESYTILAVLYLSMTLILSAGVQLLERRMHGGRK